MILLSVKRTILFLIIFFILTSMGSCSKRTEERQNLETLLAKAAANESDEKWEMILCASIEVGERLGMDLNALVHLSEVIPEVYRSHYYNGAAHGIPWPFQDLQGCYRAIDQSIPSQYRKGMYFGPIQWMVEELEGDPEKILPMLKDVPERAQFAIVNGIRIGLLLLFQKKPEDAIPYALSYPKRFHDEIFEELGWWVGQNDGDKVEKFQSIVEKIPKANWPALYHGYIRGLRLGTSISVYEEIIARFPSEFQKVCYESLFDRVVVWFGPDKNNIMEAMNTIRRKDMLLNLPKTLKNHSDMPKLPQ